MVKELHVHTSQAKKQFLWASKNKEEKNLSGSYLSNSIHTYAGIFRGESSYMTAFGFYDHEVLGKTHSESFVL